MVRRKIKVLVCGKINLSLNITGREEGFHALDMVMASVNLTDAVTVCERFDDKLNVRFNGINIDPVRNTAFAAAELLRRRFGSFGADVVVDKRLPVAGGMGGSSADAAGVIAALDYLFDLSSRGLDAPSAASEIGSDVPYMLKGGFARVTGRGERVEFFDAPAQIFAVIATGETGVTTAAAYRRFDELYPSFRCSPSDNDALVDSLKKGDVGGALCHCGNALTRASATVEPSVAATLASVSALRPAACFMTGSGSCVVGAFASAAEAEDAALRLRREGLSAQAVCSRPRGIEFV